jgi:hypothetical protein
MDGAFPQGLGPFYRQTASAPVKRANLDGLNSSFIAGDACGCAWVCANWRRIAETPGVRSR